MEGYFQQAQDPADYDPESETQISDRVYESMSESAVSEFLLGEGIPEKYCAILKGMWAGVCKIKGPSLYMFQYFLS